MLLDFALPMEVVGGVKNMAAIKELRVELHSARPMVVVDDVNS